jgi:hypothetical protein
LEQKGTVKIALDNRLVSICLVANPQDLPLDVAAQLADISPLRFRDIAYKLPYLLAATNDSLSVCYKVAGHRLLQAIVARFALPNDN